MAGYALRYYKDFGVQDAIVRVEIHKLYAAVEFAPAPIEIGGVLTALNLHLQGDQGDVTDPIVKTSLEMSLVDSPGSEYGRFTGPYEEFYTPNSTEYLFKVFIDGVQEWSGYLTPDSFEEDITAYGVVTITARDNIGHLQDFMFEENGNSAGMISVMEIMQKAWQLVESPMKLTIPEDGDVVWPECYGYRPYEIILNVEAFADKNWYEVIEAVLDSFGLVLRYVGKNECVVYPLRSMPLLGGSDFNKVEVKPTLFQASGHRSLQRACKKILYNCKYDTVESIVSDAVKESEFAGEQLTYKCKVDGDSFSWGEHDAPVWPLIPKLTHSGWYDKSQAFTLFFNIFHYELGENMSKYETEKDVQESNVVYVAANNVTDRDISFGRDVVCRDMSIDLTLGEPISIYKDNKIERRGSAFNLHTIKYYVSFESSDGVMYWQGGDIWSDVKLDLTESYDYNQTNNQFHIDIKPGDLEGKVGVMNFHIVQIKYRFVSVGGIVADYTGLYAPITELSFGLPKYAIRYKDFKVTVNYDESHNNLIQKDAQFAASKAIYFSPKVIQNGIYLPESGYPPATPWNWPGEELMTELQVMIAQQILLYNSKPNNLLTGTLLDEVQLLRLPSLWDYNGKNHMLISGSLNLLTGYLEDVKLREYVEWGDLYPEQFKLITEDNFDVLTEDESTVIIGVK